MISAMQQTAPSQTGSGSSELNHIALRDERFAAGRLGVSVETLRTWRKQDRGPRYRKLGRAVRYSIADLEAFVEAAPAGGGVAA
jgi:hypothetical protein